MTNRIRTLLVLSPLLLLAAPAEQAPAQCLAPGLKGTWHGNDGGTYRIDTSGDEVRWVGRSGDNGSSWINVFKGWRVKGSGWKTFSGDWHDTRGPGGRGTLTVKMINDWTLVRLDSTGSPFGGTRWTRPRPHGGCNDTAGGPVDE